jgi:recombination protein RecR
LFAQLKREPIREMILALGTQVEGEATAHFIQDNCPASVAISRLAQGIPFGQDLSRIDPATLGLAMTHRIRLDPSQPEAS